MKAIKTNAINHCIDLNNNNVNLFIVQYVQEGGLFEAVECIAFSKPDLDPRVVVRAQYKSDNI